MNKLALISLLALLTALPLFPAIARADDGPTARSTMESVIHDILGILRDSKLSTDEKRTKVQQVAFDNLNFEVMGKLALGKYFRGLTDQQKADYQKEFRQLLTNTYGHTTDNYTDEDVKVTNDRKEPDNDYTVESHITGSRNGQPNQDIATVEYRLRQQDGKWKIIDFTIDGVSIVFNYRSQFQDIMNNGGIDQLLKTLRDKNAQGSK